MKHNEADDDFEAITRKLERCWLDLDEQQQESLLEGDSDDDDDDLKG